MKLRIHVIFACFCVFVFPLNILVFNRCFSVIRYYLATYTTQVNQGERNAPLCVTLYGDMGDTGARQLTTSSTYHVPFKRGQIDVFTIESVELGRIKKLDIEHADPGQ